MNTNCIMKNTCRYININTICFNNFILYKRCLEKCYFYIC